MKSTASIIVLITAVILAVFHPSKASAQSQALNGQIEGIVKDQTGAAVPDVLVTVLNVATGYKRTGQTSENGLYRFVLLPLGTFRVTAEAANYKGSIRNGIILSAGQTATVDLPLELGKLNETVTVSADSAIADVGKTYLGRVMGNREAQNLPLVSRNFHNFALLQPNVTGRPSRGGTYPMINVNGFARRIDYQLDGNSASLAGIAGTRLIGVSETYVHEVQFVTNAFAAEFGNTPGMIVNVVTPTGTNELRGWVNYRFRVPAFYTRPFFYPSPADLPDNHANYIAATAGGPVIKNRWQWYAGYEHFDRTDSTWANRLSKIKQSDRTLLIAAGLPESIFVPSIPTIEGATFFIVRTDVDLNRNHHLAARFNYGNALLKNFFQGNLNTMERSLDAVPKDASLGLQLASFTNSILNEFRFQFTRHYDGYERNARSGSGPSIVISNVVNFGPPDNADRIDPLETVNQVQDNITWTKGSHVIKSGGGFRSIDNLFRAAHFSRYTFGSIEAYRQARTGGNPYAYNSYEETFGDPEIRYHATFLNAFVQDDWKARPRLKINYGLRYDLYSVPKADPASPFPASQKFNIDKNNLAPRVGVAYALRDGNRPLVLRAGGGFYYETPWLNMYQRALLRNGSPKFASVRVSLTAGLPGIVPPAFPNRLLGPAGLVLRSLEIDSVAPDFVNMYVMHSNVQIEQALTEDLSLAVGYLHSAGRHIPVYRNINLINPIDYLTDGRGVFSNALTNETRLDPRFNSIQMAESVGVSRYDALVVSLLRRFSRGLQFSVNYTLSSSVDDAPEQNLFTVPATVSSDPYNRRLDRGYSYADQRHTFNLSFLAQPTFNFKNRVLQRFLNDNQIAISSVANSGERFNIVADRDLNRDGLFGPNIINSDRPVGINRNSGKTPAQFNLDLRYSRFFRFRDRFQLEFFGEFQNLFNINRIVQYLNVSVLTNDRGELIGPLPDFAARENNSVSQESRHVQLGLRFRF